MITSMKYLKYANSYKQKVKDKLTVAEGRWGRGGSLVGTELLFQMMTFWKWMMVMVTHYPTL